MALQPDELQRKIASDSKKKQDNEANKKINMQELQTFLNHVAWGRQDEAEAMLKANKELADCSGDVTDHAKRTFRNITGFQYAVWALDWKMWTMILSHLPNKAATEQAKEFNKGSWITEHGETVTWKKLTDAQQVYIDNYNDDRYLDWSYNHQLSKHWVDGVGVAQFHLPMHGLQEYNNPNRPFEPCPNFSTEYTLQRTLPDWLSAGISKGKFDFGILRYNSPLANCAYFFGRWDKPKIVADHSALISLYNTRVQQRGELMASLLLLEEKLKAEALKAEALKAEEETRQAKLKEERIQTLQTDMAPFLENEFKKQRTELEQRLKRVEIEHQRSLVSLSVSSPDTLHRLVQSGDIATLQLLFDLPPQLGFADVSALSISSNTSIPQRSLLLSIESTDSKYMKEKSDIQSKSKSVSSSLTSASKAQKEKGEVEGSQQMTLSSSVSVSSSTSAPATSMISKVSFDLRCISFIHLAHHFTHLQSTLRQQGVIFTLEQLGHDIQYYLAQPSTPDNQRYLKQLHSDVGLLLTQWRQGRLNNEAVTKQLNQQAFSLLKGACWSGGKTDAIEKCKNDTLVKEIDESLQKQQKADHQLWLENRLEPKEAAAFEQSLVQGLWEWWKGIALQNNPLSNLLSSYQETIVQKCIQTGKVSAEVAQYMTQEIRKEIKKSLKLDDPDYAPTAQDPLYALYKNFWDRVYGMLEVKRKQGQSVHPQNMHKVYDEVLNEILKHWQEGSLTTDVGKSFECIVQKIPKETILKGDFHDHVTKQAVAELMMQYQKSRQLLHNASSSQKQDTQPPLSKPLMLHLETRLNVIASERPPLDFQLQKACQALLVSWKAKQLNTSEQNFLEVELLKPWDQLLEQMQRKFDPMARMAFLEQELSRLLLANTGASLSVVSTASKEASNKQAFSNSSVPPATPVLFMGISGPSLTGISSGTSSAPPNIDASNVVPASGNVSANSSSVPTQGSGSMKQVAS